MQPRTIGPKTQSFIERETTIPQCVYDVIKSIARRPVRTFTQYADFVVFLLRSDDGVRLQRTSMSG